MPRYTSEWSWSYVRFCKTVMWTERAIFLLLFIYILVDQVQPQLVEEEHPFDLLIFTQQWPLTVCKEWRQHNPAHKCNFPNDKDTWSIHGVWPTKLHTIGPAFCNRSWHFDPEAIKPIEVPLTKFWTNIEEDNTGYGLWTHEWTKHGTCAAVLEPLNSEFKYFSNGLNWMYNYTMSNILSPEIVPSDIKEYSIAEIHDTIKRKVNVNPVIECRKLGGKSWLVEIRICFNKTLHLADCDGVVGFREKTVVSGPDFMFTNVLTNCDISEPIFYPKNVDEAPPQRFLVQLYKLTSWLQWFTL